MDRQPDGAGALPGGPIVKSTLAHVKGVSAVSVSQADAMVDVTVTSSYNRAVTSADAMIETATNQSYPAEVAKATKG